MKSSYNTTTTDNKKTTQSGICLVAQGLRLRALNARDQGSIPGGGTEIPHAAQYSQINKLKKKKLNQKMCRRPN